MTSSTVGSNTRCVHLVEPSEAMLTDAVAVLTATGHRKMEVVTTNAGIEALIEADAERRWDRAQSTYALHAIEPETRLEVLRWLAGRVGTLALVEFDVPPFEDRSAAHAAYVVDRYERGLAEYGTSSAVEADFLMPVLVGQFDPSAKDTHGEQPATQWCKDLSAAGFTAVEHHQIHCHWWAPAHLVVGSGGPL